MIANYVAAYKLRAAPHIIILPVRRSAQLAPPLKPELNPRRLFVGNKRINPFKRGDLRESAVPRF